MRLSLRLFVGGVICGICLILARGVWDVIKVLPEREIVGYDVSDGIGIWIGTFWTGGLVALLLTLGVAWCHVGRAAGATVEAGGRDPLLSWIVLTNCGWLGGSGVFVGIARIWDWPVILCSAAILLLAVGATYRLARQ